MNAFKELTRKVNVYGVLFAVFASVIAAALGVASLLMMLDMLGISIF